MFFSFLCSLRCTRSKQALATIVAVCDGTRKSNATNLETHVINFSIGFELLLGQTALCWLAHVLQSSAVCWQNYIIALHPLTCVDHLLHNVCLNGRIFGGNAHVGVQTLESCLSVINVILSNFQLYVNPMSNKQNSDLSNFFTVRLEQCAIHVCKRLFVFLPPDFILGVLLPPSGFIFCEL